MIFLAAIVLIAMFPVMRLMFETAWWLFKAALILTIFLCIAVAHGTVLLWEWDSGRRRRKRLATHRVALAGPKHPTLVATSRPRPKSVATNPKPMARTTVRVKPLATEPLNPYDGRPPAEIPEPVWLNDNRLGKPWLRGYLHPSWQAAWHRWRRRRRRRVAG